VRQFLGGEPQQFVAFGAVHHETGIVVAGVRGRQRRHRVRDVGHRDLVIDVPGHHAGQRDRRQDLDHGRLVEPGGRADLVVRYVRGEHHPAARRLRILHEQPQRGTGGVHHRHVFEFFEVTARVPLTQRGRHREGAQRRRADLSLTQQAGQSWQRCGQVDAHDVFRAATAAETRRRGPPRAF
jgi:hypothetical protein